MPIGRAVTKDSVNQHLTDIARVVFQMSNEIDKIEQWWNSIVKPDDLTALGFTGAEATQIQQLMTNVLLLNGLFKGTATLAVADNLRPPIRRAMGTGQF